jgi:hypothetical protein
MSYWARSAMPRDQLVLFSTTLDDRIPPDHPVRVYAELLDGYDWSAWEAQYHGRQAAGVPLQAAEELPPLAQSVPSVKSVAHPAASRYGRPQRIVRIPAHRLTALARILPYALDRRTQ